MAGEIVRQAELLGAMALCYVQQPEAYAGFGMWLVERAQWEPEDIPSAEALEAAAALLV